MATPEGFTRAMLGLPEEDNLREIVRPTTGLWHILTDKGPATVLDSKAGKSTTVYLNGRVAEDVFDALVWFGLVAILEAPDEAIAALKWAGYEFTDRRKPA